MWVPVVVGVVGDGGGAGGKTGASGCHHDGVRRGRLYGIGGGGTRFCMLLLLLLLAAATHGRLEDRGHIERTIYLWVYPGMRRSCTLVCAVTCRCIPHSEGEHEDEWAMRNVRRFRMAALDCWNECRWYTVVGRQTAAASSTRRAVTQLTRHEW